jgi:hypothetical protein
VTRARLRDVAVVYAAHVTSYGALPATLHPCPGAEVELFVTWLTAPQLERMHASEGVGQRYDYLELAGIDLRIEGRAKIDRAGTYIARNGALSWADRPIRLAEVTSAGAPFEACSQPAMLRRLHARIAGTGSYTAFMLEVLSSATYRQTVSAALAASALAASLANPASNS